MSPQTNKRKTEVLRSLADFRMLTLNQMSALLSRSPRTVRRWMKDMVASGLVESLPVPITSRRGRPESVFGVSGAGHALLCSSGILPETTTLEQVSGHGVSHQARHQSLMSWCRIHLVHLSRGSGGIACDFLSCNSPFHLAGVEGHPIVLDHVAMDGSTTEEETRCFIPDGVFTLTDTERHKTLLFFLEVDMDTEAILRNDPWQADILRKLTNYLAYFRGGSYKRYEEMWKCALDGFRVLFMANGKSRRTSLCKFVRATPPSDFVWVADESEMFRQGISGDIWTRGGKDELGQQSILGRLSRPSLLPDLNLS